MDYFRLKVYNWVMVPLSPPIIKQTEEKGVFASKSNKHLRGTNPGLYGFVILLNLFSPHFFSVCSSCWKLKLVKILVLELPDLNFTVYLFTCSFRFFSVFLQAVTFKLKVHIFNRMLKICTHLFIDKIYTCKSCFLMQLCILKLRSVQGTYVNLTSPFKPYYLYLQMFITQKL